MDYIKGFDRKQEILFSAKIDDYIGEENLVRKSKCTRNKNGRVIFRWEHEKVLDESDVCTASTDVTVGRRQLAQWLTWMHPPEAQLWAFINRDFGLRSVGVCEAYPSFDKTFISFFICG